MSTNLSQDQLQAIINAVLSSIRTNSRTIKQLSLVATPEDTDNIELSDGRRIPVAALRAALTASLRNQIDALSNSVADTNDNVEDILLALNGSEGSNDGALYELNQIAKLVGYKPGTTLSGWKNLIDAAEDYGLLCRTLEGSSPGSNDYGRPGTFVTLGDDGRINPDFILSSGVMVFDGFETPPAESIQPGSANLRWVGFVVYDKREPTFLLKQEVNGVTTYYRKWKGSDYFQESDGYPLYDRLYRLDGGENSGALYAFDQGGDDLYRVSFTKDEQAKLLEAEQNVGYLQSRVARHEERMADLEEEDTHIWKVIQGVRRGGWNTIEEAILSMLESSDDITVTKPTDAENLFNGDAIRLSLSESNRIKSLEARISALEQKVNGQTAN